MQLPPEEPYFGPWRVVSLEAFVRALQESLPEKRTGIVAVDGRSAGGKTTLAERLSQEVPGATVVHTDDLPSSGNWSGTDAYSVPDTEPSFFDWTERLLTNVVNPARTGKAVHYRPDSWEDWFRGEGAIEVPSGCPVLILEGVGAARRELMHSLDAVIWVQSDAKAAEARGIARDGGDAAIPFWNEWIAAELVFLADQKPWERANFVVCGTPDLEHDPASEVVADTRLSVEARAVSKDSSAS